MKIARKGALRDHGLEVKSFTKVRCSWNSANQDVILSSPEAKIDFGSGNSSHLYKIYINASDFSKLAEVMKNNVNNLDDDIVKDLRRCVPDLLHLVNVLSAA